MRIIECDVCAEKLEDEPIVLMLDGDPIDVCSPACLHALANVLEGKNPMAEPEPEPMPEEPEPAVIQVPSSPVFRPRDEQDIEAVTGVVRRGSGR